MRRLRADTRPSRHQHEEHESSAGMALVIPLCFGHLAIEKPMKASCLSENTHSSMRHSVFDFCPYPRLSFVPSFILFWIKSSLLYPAFAMTIFFIHPNFNYSSLFLLDANMTALFNAPLVVYSPLLSVASLNEPYSNCFELTTHKIITLRSPHLRTSDGFVQGTSRGLNQLPLLGNSAARGGTGSGSRATASASSVPVWPVSGPDLLHFGASVRSLTRIRCLSITASLALSLAWRNRID